MRARTWMACLALAVVAGCGHDDTNDPPQIVIVAPENGDHLAAAANVVAVPSDDEFVDRVRFTIGGTVLMDVDISPWQAAIPVGEWASGLPVVLGATVWDSDGVSRSAAEVTVTIDPALQTVPQVVAFGPDPTTLAVRWLSFPGAAGYTVQLSRGEDFHAVFLEQAVADTQLATGVAAEGVAYARVRAGLVGDTSRWSRPGRFAAVPSLLTAAPLAGSQSGLQVAMVPPGGFAVVSGERAGVSIGPVTPELIRLDGSGLVTGRATLPVSAAQWLADADAYLGGDDWVARHALVDGAQVWRVQPGAMRPTAVGAAAAGSQLLAAGRDLLEDLTPSIAIVSLARSDGAEVGRATFDLPAGDTVSQVWGFPTVCVVAGEMAEGGVWVRGVDLSTQQEAWRLRLGTSQMFRVRDAVPVGNTLVLVGDARIGGAWVASVALDGRLRYLVREIATVELAGVAPAADGGAMVAGHALAENDSGELVWGELTAGGAWRWKQRRAFGQSARGLGVTQADDGSVVVVGTALPFGGDWDLLLLRSDDRGDLD